MRPEELASSISRIIEHSPAFPGDRLKIDLIANPRAGGFLRRGYSKRHRAALAELERRAAALPVRKAETEVELHLTERTGHASDIARGILEGAKSDGPDKRRLIFTAGGDGTSLETASAMVEMPMSEHGRFALLRLPMGTGNDGSEGRDLISCLGRLLGPMIHAPRRALRITPNPAGGKKPQWSFNIASVGVDAFICRMTNRLKSIFPGDSYKFWVDMASVFYDLAWPASELSLRAEDLDGRETAAFKKVCLLVAMGVSGRRTYGSNKPILPDDDNVCTVFHMPLLKKLAFKDQISSGGHRGLGAEFVSLFSAARLKLDYDRGLLFQSDGEVTELAASDFPLDIELSEPVYNVLSPA